MGFCHKQCKYGLAIPFRYDIIDHLCIKGEGIVIVDAGGGTIDISTYRRDGQDSKRIFEEIAVPQCKAPKSFCQSCTDRLVGYFHGSVFVTFNAKDFLKGE